MTLYSFSVQQENLLNGQKSYVKIIECTKISTKMLIETPSVVLRYGEPKLNLWTLLTPTHGMVLIKIPDFLEFKAIIGYKAESLCIMIYIFVFFMILYKKVFS